MTPFERARARIKEWRHNPRKFVVDNFQVKLDAWQEDALTHLGGDANPRRRLTLRACTGPGKSAVLAWAGWHRLSCFGDVGEHPKGAAISGEGRENLRDNLWAELSKWQRRSEFLSRAFNWNKEQITAKDHPETWFLSARGYAKDADTESIGQSMSGLHSKYPFVLLDETGRMPITIGQKAEQIFTGGNIDALIMQAGNPTDVGGLLYHSCVGMAGQYIVITITADPDDPKRTPRVDIEHAREQIRLYGRENPWVMSTILGLFPPSSLNSLIGPEEVEAAMKRQITLEDYEYAQKRLGVDVARFGDDRTCLFPRQGLRAFNPAIMRNARSNEVAARVALAKHKWAGEVLEFVDDTGGWGSGVIDSLIQSGYSPISVNFSGKADDGKYLNKRAEMWFRMTEWVRRGGSLPPDNDLIKELTAPTYTFQNGKFALEDKKQIKARLGFSPDKADALALTFAQVDMPGRLPLSAPGEMLQQRLADSGLKHDYNPYASDKD